MSFRRSTPSPMSGQTSQNHQGIIITMPSYMDYLRLTNPFTPPPFNTNIGFPEPDQLVNPLPDKDDPMYPFEICINQTFVAIFADILYAHINWPCKDVEVPMKCSSSCATTSSPDACCTCGVQIDSANFPKETKFQPIAPNGQATSQEKIKLVPVEFFDYLNNLYPTKAGTPMDTKAEKQKEFSRKVELYNAKLAVDYNRYNFQAFVKSTLSKIETYFKNVSLVPYDYKFQYGYDRKTLEPHEEMDDENNNRVSFMVESLLKAWSHDGSTPKPTDQSPTVLLIFNRNNYQNNRNFVNYRSFFPNKVYVDRSHCCIGRTSFASQQMCVYACSTIKHVMFGSSTVKNNGLLGVENCFFNSIFPLAEHITTRLTKPTSGIINTDQSLFTNNNPREIDKTNEQQVAEANFDVPLHLKDKFHPVQVEKMETKFERDFVIGSYNFYDMPALIHLTLDSLPLSPIIRDLDMRNYGETKMSISKQSKLPRFSVGPTHTDPLPSTFPPTWVLPVDFFDNTAQALEYDQNLPKAPDQEQVEFPLLYESSSHLVCKCSKLVSVELSFNRVEYLWQCFNDLPLLTRVKLRMNDGPIMVKNPERGKDDLNFSRCFNVNPSVMVGCFNNCPSLVEVQCEDVFRGVVKMQGSWNNVGDSKTPIKNLRFPNLCHIDVSLNNAHVDVLNLGKLKTINGRSFTAGTAPRSLVIEKNENTPQLKAPHHYVLVNVSSTPFRDEIFGGNRIQVNGTSMSVTHMFRTSEHTLPDFFSYFVDWSHKLPPLAHSPRATLWRSPHVQQASAEPLCPDYEYEVETAASKTRHAERSARRAANLFAQEVAARFVPTTASASPAHHPATVPSSKTASQTDAADNLPKAVPPPLKTSSNVPQEAGTRRTRDSTEDSKMTGNTPANDSGDKKQKKPSAAKK